MKIKLRPYHPTWVLCYFADQSIAKEDHNKKGFDFVIKTLCEHPGAEIELVREFDDVCSRCAKLKPNPAGSVWGDGRSCASSDNPKTVRQVHESNDWTLSTLGLKYGSTIKWMELVRLLKEKMPEIRDPMIGGPDNQGRYEKGLALCLKSQPFARM
ncbi:MAG: DUF1284 domain-containing protein [Verrucomicrobiae bacterium]|nr:DUF1284 domain-containing protein [Verrucomicrobiae bacterium]